MRTCPALILLAATSLTGACSYTNLEGDYEGEIDCGSDGSVDVEMEVEESGTAYYRGLMLVQPITLDGVDTAFELSLGFEQTAANGGQVLTVDEADCIARFGNDQSADLDCSDFGELGFDGENTISAEISDFLSTGLDCELAVER